MKHRVFGAFSVLIIVVAIVSLAPAPVAGQYQEAAASEAPQGWTSARTPWGNPDLQGVWDFRTITPLERPAALAGKAVLTDEEAAAFEEAEYRRQNRDLVNPKQGGAGYPAESEGGVVPYNEFWYDRGTKLLGSRQTSLITDPEDGRVPALTPEARQRLDARGSRRDEPAAGPEDRNLWERCITRDLPRLSGAYNNNMEVLQGPGYVVLLYQMVHDARVIPLDGRAHVPGSVRQWLGDSRGHWEGDTLVVETKNFTDKTNFRGSGENLHLVERFRRAGPGTLQYEFTVSDTTVWERNWTASFPMALSPEPMYEYACHEGNTGLAGILTGARADEREALRQGSR